MYLLLVIFSSLSLAGWKLGGENYRGLRRKGVKKCSRSSNVNKE
jgi:hypothetical protein